MQTELAQLELLLRSLGAEGKTAATMAAQLLKRAEQLAKERGVGKPEALDYLLRLTMAGREGRVYEGEPPGTAPENGKKG